MFGKMSAIKKKGVVNSRIDERKGTNNNNTFYIFHLLNDNFV